MSSKPVNSRRRKAVREEAVPVEPGGKYGKKHSPASKRMQSQFTVKRNAQSTVQQSPGKGKAGNKSPASGKANAAFSKSAGEQTTTQTAKQATANTATSKAGKQKRTAATSSGKTKGEHTGKPPNKNTIRDRGNTIGNQRNTIGNQRRKPVRTRAGAAASQADSVVQAENPMISEVATEFSGGATDPIDHLSARFQRTLSRVFRKGRALRSDAKPPTVKLIKAICAVIRQGNHVETAVRAFGIRSNVYRQWVDRGFEDIAAGDSTPYALFVAACDAADAQTEALDIMAIRHGIENWQALAWLRERKSFARWGLKSMQLTAGASEPMASKLEHSKALEPELAANVLVALEEAGIVTVPGREHESGIPEEIIVEGRAQDTATADQGEEVVAELRD